MRFVLNTLRDAGVLVNSEKLVFEDCESINYLGVKLNFSNGRLEILPPKHRVYVTEIGERTTLCPCAKHSAYSAKCATCLPFSPLFGLLRMQSHRG